MPALSDTGISDSDQITSDTTPDVIGDGESGSDAPELRIDPTGFVARTVSLPGVAAGNYAALTAVEGAVLYLAFPEGGAPRLTRYDLKSREEQTVAEGVGQYILASRGERVLFQARGEWTVVPIQPDASAYRSKGYQRSNDPTKRSWMNALYFPD